MKIDKIGFYKTRDGQKATVENIRYANNLYPIRGHLDGSKVILWTVDGKYYHGCKSPKEMDLVSIWEESADEKLIMDAQDEKMLERLKEVVFVENETPDCTNPRIFEHSLSNHQLQVAINSILGYLEKNPTNEKMQLCLEQYFNIQLKRAGYGKQ